MVDIAWADTAAMRALPDGAHTVDLADWIDLELKIRKGHKLTAGEKELHEHLDRSL